MYMSVCQYHKVKAQFDIGSASRGLSWVASGVRNSQFAIHNAFICSCIYIYKFVSATAAMTQQLAAAALHMRLELWTQGPALHIHMFVCLYMLNYPAYISATFSNNFKLPMKEIRENNAPIICHLFIIKSFAMTKKITTPHSTNKDCVCVCLTRKQRRSSSLVGVRNGLIEDCVWQRNTSFVNGSTYRTNNLWPTSKI